MSKKSPHLNRAKPIDEGVWQFVHKYVPREVYQLLRIQQQWPILAGPSLYLQTWPANLSKGILLIHVSDHQWLHELNYLRHDLLTKICQSFSELSLHELKLRIGQIPEENIRTRWQYLDESVQGRDYQAVLAEVPEAETMQAMTCVRDEELKQAIAAARLMLGKR